MRTPVRHAALAAGWLGTALLLAAWASAAPTAPPEVNDANVRAAMAAAVKYLYASANEQGIWEPPTPPDFKAIVKKGVTGGTALMDSQWPGQTALALNALAAAGEQSDPRFKKALAWLMKQEVYGAYALGMRMELIHRLRDSEPYRDVLTADARMLAKGLRTGKEGAMWQYLPPPATTFYSCIGDFSNTNYGVLGLWAASDERLEIPSRVWKSLEKTYLTGQLEDGSWAYYHGTLPQAKVNGAGGASASMTTAGMASLYLVLDQLYVRRGALGEFRRTEAYKAIGRGMKWMETHFSATGNPGWDEFATYYFYNCERVAHAAGLKYFGTHDWFRGMAATLLRAQRADGSVSWKTPAGYGGVHTDTCFALLFLAKGSAPVIFNKLAHGGDWDNHIRELASLSEWIAQQSERPANWQVVNLKVAPEELTDSRILYLAGTEPLKFSDEELAKLKRFVELGGMLVFCPDASSRTFAVSARAVLEKLWPRLEVEDVDLAAHRLGSIYKPLRDRRLRIQQLASPTRVFAFLVSGDPATAWERRLVATDEPMFDLGAALHYFANDRAMLRDMPTKLTRFGDLFAAPPPKTERTIRVGRLRYGENPHRWDPEPLAFDRFARRLAAEAKLGCEPVALEPAGLADSGLKIAHLTGVDDPRLSDEQLAAIGAWLKAGGALIVDQAGGPLVLRSEAPLRGAAPAGREGTFDTAIRRMVKGWVGGVGLRSMDAAHPLIRDLDAIPYRHVMDVPRKRMAAILEYAELDGRVAVIYSPYDLTCGLLGNPNPLVSGADDEGAYRLLRHLLERLSPAARGGLE